MIRARLLLQKAQACFDGTSLADRSRGAWRGGFVSGAEWMRQAMAELRGHAPTGQASFALLGLMKYGLALTVAGILFFAVDYSVGRTWAFLTLVPAFYGVEAQMVFLFPLVLDGATRPWVQSLRWTRRAGGTLAVMRVVLPLAATMLLGGFLGRGFSRSWCIGCLAVCYWYESLMSESAMGDLRGRQIETAEYAPQG